MAGYRSSESLPIYLRRFFSLFRGVSDDAVDKIIHSIESSGVTLPPVLVYRPVVDGFEADFFRFVIKNSVSGDYIPWDFLVLEWSGPDSLYVFIPAPASTGAEASTSLPPGYSLADLSCPTPELVGALGVQVVKLMAGDAAALFSVSEVTQANSAIQGSWPERLTEDGERLAAASTWFPSLFLPEPVANTAFVMYEEGRVVATSHSSGQPRGGSPGDASCALDTDLEL